MSLDMDEGPSSQDTLCGEPFQAEASQVDGDVLLEVDEEGYSSQEFSTFCDDFEKAAEDSQAKNSQESLLNRPLEKKTKRQDRVKKLIHKAKGNDALRSFSSRAEEYYSQFSSRAYSQFQESQAKDSQAEVSQVEASQVEASQVDQAKNSQLDQEVDHWIKSIEASQVEPSLPPQPKTRNVRKARPLKPEPESPARS